MKIDYSYRVAWRFELASSISGSGEGFGDLDDDCIWDADESWEGGASNLLIVPSNNFSSFYVAADVDMIIYFAWNYLLPRITPLYLLSILLVFIHISHFTFLRRRSPRANLEDNKSLWNSQKPLGKSSSSSWERMWVVSVLLSWKRSFVCEMNIYCKGETYSRNTKFVTLLGNSHLI